MYVEGIEWRKKIFSHQKDEMPGFLCAKNISDGKNCLGSKKEAGNEKTEKEKEKNLVKRWA